MNPTLIKIRAYNIIILMIIPLAIILLGLYEVCLATIYPDPSRIRDASLYNEVKENRGEIEITFHQELPSRVIEIPFSLGLYYDITKAYVDIGSNKLIHHSSNITDSMKSNSIVTNGNRNISAYSRTGIVTIGKEKGNSIITKMNTYSVNDNSIAMPYLGLGRNFESSDDSLIETLHRAGIISIKQYSILYSYPDWGTLTLGNQSYFVLTSPPSLRKTCNAVNNEYNNHKWACQLKGIFFGDKQNTDASDTGYDIDPIQSQAIKIDSPGYFSTTEHNIVVPFSFMLFLKQYYFKSFIESGQCYFDEKPIGQLTTFYCDRSYIHFLELINFSFGDFALVYYPSKLFPKGEDKYNRFTIVSNKLSDDWVLGIEFINSFLMTFNYESDQVSFFSLLNKIPLKPIKYYYDINDLKLLSYNYNRSISILLKLIIGINAIGAIVSGISFYSQGYKYL